MKYLSLMPKGQEVTMDVNGRIYIPADLRKKLGLEGKKRFEMFITEDNMLLYRLVG
jgi:AbrB family looped-hinge helix DNA binding protein